MIIFLIQIWIIILSIVLFLFRVNLPTPSLHHGNLST